MGILDFFKYLETDSGERIPFRKIKKFELKMNINGKIVKVGEYDELVQPDEVEYPDDWDTAILYAVLTNGRKRRVWTHTNINKLAEKSKDYDIPKGDSLEEFINSVNELMKKKKAIDNIFDQLFPKRNDEELLNSLIDKITKYQQLASKLGMGGYPRDKYPSWMLALTDPMFRQSIIEIMTGIAEIASVESRKEPEANIYVPKIRRRSAHAKTRTAGNYRKLGQDRERRESRGGKEVSGQYKEDSEVKTGNVEVSENAEGRAGTGDSRISPAHDTTRVQTDSSPDTGGGDTEPDEPEIVIPKGAKIDIDDSDAVIEEV